MTGATLCEIVQRGFVVQVDEWADPAARPDFTKALETIRSIGLQLTEVVERLDEEQVDAAGFQQLRLLGEQRPPVVLGVADVAQRADGARDDDLPARERISPTIQSSGRGGSGRSAPGR